MKPAPFTYAAPSTLEEALILLSEHSDAVKLLAGGQSLMPMLNLRLARPQYIVDLNRIPGLDYIAERDGMLVVGALTRQRSLERSPSVQHDYPLLYEATTLIGHRAIRNRGTVGGSLAHADPAAELPAALVAHGLRFGLGGYALDAACASSLYAIKLACDELLAGRADAMAKDSRPDAEKVKELFLWTVGHKPNEKQLKLALEQGLRRNRVSQVSGIRWSFDPSRPPLQRVVTLTLADGAPLNDTHLYRVACNNFMATGGDDAGGLDAQWPGEARRRNAFTAPFLYVHDRTATRGKDGGQQRSRAVVSSAA